MRLLVYFFILLLSPILFLYIYRKILPTWMAPASIVYFLFLFVIAFPIGNFAYTMSNVGYITADVCRDSIVALERYQRIRFTKFYDELLLTKTFDLHPDIHTHTSLALCHYVTGNYMAAKASIDAVSSYENGEFDSYVETSKLAKLRLAIEEKMNSEFTKR